MELMAGKRAARGAADREVMTQADSVVRTLPKPFLDFIESLQAAKFGDGLGQSAGFNPGPIETAECVDGGRGYDSKVPLRSGYDSARNLEDSIHRRLREMARKGMAALGGVVAAEKRCAGCGRYGEATWSYCAHCGVPVGGVAR